MHEDKQRDKFHPAVIPACQRASSKKRERLRTLRIEQAINYIKMMIVLPVKDNTSWIIHR
jgi:hypothetical protein